MSSCRLISHFRTTILGTAMMVAAVSVATGAIAGEDFASFETKANVSAEATNPTQDKSASSIPTFLEFERRDYLAKRESGAVGIMGGADGMFQLIGMFGQAENELTGTIQYSQGSVGSVLDVERDLGIKKESAQIYGGQLRIGALRIGGSYQKYDMNGQGTTNFTFGSVAFTGTTDTQISVTNYTGEIGFSFGIGPIEFGLGLGVHVYDMAFRITGTEQISGLTRTEEDDFIGPVPVLAVYAGFDLLGIAIEPTLHIIKAPEIQGVEGMLYDISVMIRWFPVSNISVGVEGGYTFLNVEKNDGAGTNDTTNGDIDLKSMRIALLAGVSF